MGCAIERPVIFEPELLSCPVLSDADLIYDTGMYYIVGWSFSAGIGGAPGEYRVTLRAAACPLVARAIFGKGMKLLGSGLH